MCPPKSKAVVGAGCQVESPTTGLFFDFNKLKKYDITDSSNGKDHVVAICQPIDQPKCGTGASVCYDGQNWGSWNDKINLVETTTGEPEIYILYRNGDACSGDKDRSTRETKIVLQCDPTQNEDTSTPTYNAFASSTCLRYYVWKTKYACKVRAESECIVQDTDGTTYDLTALRRVSNDASDWTAQVSLGGDYAFKYVAAAVPYCPALI